MTGRDDDFFAGFLDDYFAESEEHLASVRRALLALEDNPGGAAAETTLLEDLFRSFHSLKGISAMVGVREAERVAHELESCLREARSGHLPLSPDALTLLMDATSALETVIAARRAGAPAPAVDAVVARLASFAGAARSDAASLPASPAAGAGAPTWCFRFVPSAALVERGIKVDTVRARLSSIGTVVSVSPRVAPGGGIVFEFLLSGAIDEAALEGWADDGLTWARLPPEHAPAGEIARDPRPEAAPVEHAILAPSHFVRVDLKRLDDVMRRVADLVVTRARLEGNFARLEPVVPAQDWRALQENSVLFDRQLKALREDVMRVRLVRVDEIFRRMPFVVRDLAREADKDVRVVLAGQETEIDKFLVERMMDPVLHLVRNAVSHGIEAPDARRAAGRPAHGTVTLRASTSGEMVVLEISDDGRGIDAAAVAARARQAGIRVPEGPLDNRTLLDLLCAPGLSTREETDRASGRGIGMSVVRTTVQELGGTLDLETDAGRGTRFVITLPLTLAITGALIATVGGQMFAVPQSSVTEVVEVESAAVRRLERNEVVAYRGRAVPLVRLGAIFGLRSDGRARLHAFIVGSGLDAVAIAVDRIVGQREIVVRTVSDPLLRIDGVSGATELGDGRAVLILDIGALSRRARLGPTEGGRPGDGRAAAAAPARSANRGAPA